MVTCSTITCGSRICKAIDENMYDVITLMLLQRTQRRTKNASQPSQDRAINKQTKLHLTSHQFKLIHNHYSIYWIKNVKQVSADPVFE
jgi:hypothetical protein